jgi:hypothetical protein
MFIPDPGSDFFHPGSRIRIFPSRIRIKEFKYFNPKKGFLSSRKYDPGCSSRIRILTFYPSRIPDPGSRVQKGNGSRIRIVGRQLILTLWQVHVLHKASGKWYEMQDLHVTEILPQMITLTEAYIQVQASRREFTKKYFMFLGQLVYGSLISRDILGGLDFFDPNIP